MDIGQMSLAILGAAANLAAILGVFIQVAPRFPSPTQAGAASPIPLPSPLGVWARVRNTITRPNIFSCLLLISIFGSALLIYLSALGKVPQLSPIAGARIGATIAVVTAFLVVLGSLNSRIQSIIQNARRSPVMLFSLVTVLLAATVFLSLQQPPIPPPIPPSIFMNLDDNVSLWTTIQGDAKGQPTNVSDVIADNTALKVSLAKGFPGSSILAERTLPAADTATTFQLTLSFYLRSTPPIGALTFSMDKWVNNQRWEWRLQWLNIPGGASLPSWHVWDGKNWQSIPGGQSLDANTWYTLHLFGTISSDGQAHYINFSCGDKSALLGQTFAPVSDPGAARLAVTVELRGDAQGDPYDLYIDEVSLQTS